MIRPTWPRSPLTARNNVAIAAFIILLGSLGLAALTPWLALEETRRAIGDAEMIVSHLTKSAEAARGAAGDRAPDAALYIMNSETATIASATLQRRMTAALNAAGGTVLSSEINVPDPADTRQRIELTLSFEIDAIGLQAALHQLEAEAPAVFAEHLQVRVASGADANAPVRLQGSVTMSAFWSSKP